MTICTFGPHVATVCTTSPHAAPWWTPLGTETPLWAYLAVVAFIALASWSASWLKDHYELAGRRPVRRWYGTGAWVTLRRDAGVSLDTYRVAGWSGDSTAVPWLLVSCTGNEDSGAFWAAVTDFSPYAIRRFRPWLWRGWLPMLFARETLPVTHPGGPS